MLETRRRGKIQRASLHLGQEKPQLPIPSTLPKMLFLRSEAEVLDRNAATILSMIHTLESELMELDKGFSSFVWKLIFQDIKKDQNAIDNTVSSLLTAQQKRADIAKKVKETQDWLEGANENMKNFQSSYSSLYNEFGKMKTHTLPEISKVVTPL
jgi:seryl-tRNA synthetase